MSLLQSLVDRYRVLVLYDGKIFFPTEVKDPSRHQHTLLEGENLALCQSHEIQTPTLESFVHNHAIPIIQGPIDEGMELKKLQQIDKIFPSIATYPLILTKNQGVFYTTGKTGLKLHGKNFGQYKSHTLPEIEKRFLKMTGGSKREHSIPIVKIEKTANSILLRKKIQGFSIYNKHKKYVFDPVTIQVKLEKGPLGVKICEPTVVEQNYPHPFVYANGKICFGNESRWVQNGIQLWKYIAHYQTHEFAQMVKRTFGETQNLLEKGYFGTLIPIRTLTPANFYNQMIDRQLGARSLGAILL